MALGGFLRRGTVGLEAVYPCTVEEATTVIEARRELAQRYRERKMENWQLATIRLAGWSADDWSRLGIY